MILTTEWLKEKGIEHTVSPEGLISVPENLSLRGTPITSLGKLKEVGGYLYADGLDTYTIEGFKKMVLAYKKMDVMDAPKAHVLAELTWQKKACEEIMEAV